MKCKHEECVVTESWDAFIEFTFENGALASISKSYGAPRSTLFVRCLCGMERFISVHSAPKWLKKLFEQVEDGPFAMFPEDV